MYFSTTAGSLLCAAALVSAHCKITNSVGDQGGKAAAFGIQKVDNSQNDVTIFKKGDFGATASGQAIDPAKDLAAVQALSGKTLPQVSAGGQLNITLHQINGDGAGPMACSIDTAASGTFTDITIITDVPGNKGNSNANNQDFPLVVEIAAGTACTGKLGATANVCLVKCQNPTGPFGGVVPIQIAGGAASAAGAAGGAGGNGGAKAGAKTAGKQGAKKRAIKKVF